MRSWLTITPTDDTPGARVMGVVRFIDQAPAGFLSPLAPVFKGLARRTKARLLSVLLTP
jgi:hypothetical protein